VTSIAVQVAEFVEQHTDMTLDPWQRAALDGLYATASPSSTD
jgi:hypothetical protein